MAFEVFDKQPYASRRVADPYVKVLTNGDALYLSLSAQELLGEASYVAFLFDAEKRMAAIKPASPENPNAYKVSQGRQVGARRFVRHYGLQWGQLCPAHFKDGMLVFEVGEKVSPPTP